MKTLALVNGDLVAGPTGHLTVSGAPRIRQDMALALGEEHGTDRFHPELGSVLIEFIGQPIDDETEMLVRAEVGRVIQQYIAVQQREVLRDHLAARRSRFDASDVITGVSDVRAEVTYDVVRISATLTTQSGARVGISRTVTP